MQKRWLEHFCKHRHICEFLGNEGKEGSESGLMMDKIDKKALLNVKEMCEYLGIGQTKARELLADPKNSFTIRIGNRLYAHKGRLDTWLLNQIL